MGNKAAVQLEVPEAQVLHGEAMNVNEEGCSASPRGAPAGASDGSGDDERAYASPAEVEEEAEATERVAGPVTGERAEDAINFTRNNSQTSVSNNRVSGSPPAAAALVGAAGEAEGVETTPSDQQAPDAAAENTAAADVVLPPPPLVPTSTLSSASPPRVPVGNDLQLPPLNDPSGPEEAARLAVRGSPNSSAEGRDQKGAQ